MKAFCLDDHDHDVSIASLSVQIFTVISLVCSSGDSCLQGFIERSVILTQKKMGKQFLNAKK